MLKPKPKAFCDFGKPKNFFLNLTYKCPLACKYCYVNQESGSDMKLEETDHIVEKLLKNKMAYSITFFGGEPALRIDIIEHILKKYYGGSVWFSLITSFSVNQEKIIELARAYPNFEITISYDAPENHQRIMHSGKPLEITESMLQDLPQNICLIKVLTGKEKNIEKDLVSYAEMAARLHIEADLSYARFQDENIESKYLSSGYEAYAATVMQQLLDNRILSLPHHIAINIVNETKKNVGYQGGCGFLQDIYVSAGGRMAPCSISNQDSNIDMRNRSLINKLAEEELKCKENEKCKKCEIRHFCSGGCIMERRRDGDAKMPCEKWCVYAKAVHTGFKNAWDSFSEKEKIKLTDAAYTKQIQTREWCKNGPNRIFRGGNVE